MDNRKQQLFLFERDGSGHFTESSRQVHLDAGLRVVGDRIEGISNNRLEMYHSVIDMYDTRLTERTKERDNLRALAATGLAIFSLVLVFLSLVLYP